MDNRLQDLLRRANTAFGYRSPEEAIPKTRAIVGPWNIPNSQAVASAAMAKLKSGVIPAAEELIALEFVVRLMRPAPLIKRGVPAPIDYTGNLHSQEVIDRWLKFQRNAAPITRAVGRIDHPHPSLGHVGTGFLVAEGVLATNEHVLELLSGGTGILPEDSGIKVNFDQEYEDQDADDAIAGVIGVIAKHPSLDIVLLKVEKHRSRPPLKLDSHSVLEPGHPVAVVGYPGQSSGTNPLFADQIFCGKYGVKRAAMGEVIRSGRQSLFFHDCSTLGGNSGSPVISLANHDVVGIHCSGSFVYRNEAIAAHEIIPLI